MKKLACELCGGELIKDNGVFVCQNCGCKYSLEEAKKLMADIVESSTSAANHTQFDNLFRLAKSALESKNDAEAERQANLALGINVMDYDTWLIKAKAVANQTSGAKSRLPEALNCYLSAYEMLSEEEREIKKSSLFNEIIITLKNEISFWIGLIEKSRPSGKTVNDAISSLNQSISAVDTAGRKMNMETAEAKKLVTNCFISGVSSMAYSAWKSTVAYNYYRDSLSDYGQHWKTSGKDITDEFRPTDEIFFTFGKEVDDMISVMEYATNIKNDETNYAILAALYSNMAYYLGKKKDSVSFKRFKWSNNYGGYYEYWTLNRFWNIETKNNFSAKIIHWNELKEKYESLAAQEKARLEAERKAKAEAEGIARFIAFWDEHKEERIKLENEKAELQQRISFFHLELAKVPGQDTVAELTRNIDSLKTEKEALGLFQMKEKKAVQDKIDEKISLLNAAETKLNNGMNPIRAKIAALQARISQIDEELTKAR